jgi:hypothetical protein
MTTGFGVVSIGGSFYTLRSGNVKKSQGLEMTKERAVTHLWFDYVN